MAGTLRGLQEEKKVTGERRREEKSRERVTNVELQREEGWLVALGHRGATPPLTFAEKFDFHT